MTDEELKKRFENASNERVIIWLTCLIILIVVVIK